MRRSAASSLVVGMLAVGSLMSLLHCHRTADVESPDLEHPNLLLITVESLRPDHLSLHDGARDTSPNIARLAREALVLDNAHAVTSWTLASHASLFTGLYPTAHATVMPTDRLADAHTTLAEVLAARGYQTHGVVSGPYLLPAHNLDQGFEGWNTSPSAPEHAEAHGSITNEAMLAGMLDFLDHGWDRQRPFFLFGYFWDPHYDYLPPSPWDRAFVTDDCVEVDLHDYGTTQRINAGSPDGHIRYAESQYDGEILWTDHTLGLLFDGLAERGLWRGTMVVLTSDHGQEFFEHGSKGHKNNLYVESVHVPLLVKLAVSDPEARRDSRLASLVDVVPTVLDGLGLDTTSWNGLHGHSLLDLEPPDGRSIYFDLVSIWAATYADGTRSVESTWWVGIQRGDLKLVGVPPDRFELYDHGTDPGERVNLLLTTDPISLQRAVQLQQELQTHRRDMEAQQLTGSDEDADLDEAARERLRALGYLAE
jgi:arylsulfatase A-like enzyme